MEEFATDLAVVFFGFGVFGGNPSFQFNQTRDDGQGTQGWSIDRIGYLTQNEWGLALAIRAALTEDDMAPLADHGSIGLLTHFKNNMKYLRKNRKEISHLLKQH